MYNSANRKIEYYLYTYDLLDFKIEKLKEFFNNSDYSQNYEKWLKHKSSSLEDQAIKNINLEKRISKLAKWKKLIFEVLEDYKKKDILKYKFICLKYFRRLRTEKIQEILSLDDKEQEDIKNEFLDYIYFVAIEKQMLKEVNV